MRVRPPPRFSIGGPSFGVPPSRGPPCVASGSLCTGVLRRRQALLPGGGGARLAQQEKPEVRGGFLPMKELAGARVKPGTSFGCELLVFSAPLDHLGVSGDCFVHAVELGKFTEDARRNVIHHTSAK